MPLWRRPGICGNICGKSGIKLHMGMQAVGGEAILAAHLQHWPKSLRYQVAI